MLRTGVGVVGLRAEGLGMKEGGGGAGRQGGCLVAEFEVEWGGMSWLVVIA